MTSSSSVVTPEVVRRVAELARLRLPEEDAVSGLDPDEKAWARSLRAWVAIRALNPVAILKLRAPFAESKPQQAASPGLFHRVSLDMAAEGAGTSRKLDVAARTFGYLRDVGVFAGLVQLVDEAADRFRVEPAARLIAAGLDQFDRHQPGQPDALGAAVAFLRRRLAEQSRQAAA